MTGKATPVTSKNTEMENILLKKYLKLTGGVELCDWYHTRSNRISESFALREICVQKYTWAIPNKAAIKMLVKHSPIVEIGAGTGYWAALVKDAGGDIVAFDAHPPHIDSDKNQYHPNQAMFFPVKRGFESAAAKHSDRSLFLCWPPYNSQMAHRSLQLYTGQTVIFVGEGNGGCTGDEDFFHLLESEFTLEKEVSIPQWSGIHDRMMLYSRINLDKKRKRMLKFCRTKL
jgi:hypothetical protein